MAVAGHPEEHHAGGELSYEFKEARTRWGVILLIVSDAMFVGAQFAAAGYLRVLNTDHAYKGAHEAAPSFLAGLFLSLATIAAALIYFWGQREWHKGRPNSFRLANLVATLLALGALAGQLTLLAGTHYLGDAPAQGEFHLSGFASSAMFITAYHSVHLFIAALLGILMLGRIANNRLKGHEYVIEGAGLWWYYVAIISTLTWLLTALIV